MILRSTLLISIIAVGILHAQEYNFAVHGGGSAKEEFFDLETDDAGNVYTLFMYRENVTFDDDTYLNSDKNVLLVKHDSQGNKLFTIDIPSQQPNFLEGAIGVSADGQMIVGTKTQTGVIAGHTVYSGGFIGKVNNNGSYDWILQPTERSSGYDLTQDKFKIISIEVFGNDIYVGATVKANGITMGGVNDDFSSTVVENEYGLLIKIALDGSVQWMKHIPNSGTPNSQSMRGGFDYIHRSADGYIYVAGKFGDGSINDYEVAFLSKFSTEGTHLWTRKTSSSGADSWGIAETSAGNLIMGFDVGGAQTLDFGTGITLETGAYGGLGALAFITPDGTITDIRNFSDVYADPADISAFANIHINQILMNDNDQLVFLGSVDGNNALKNGVDINSQAGIAGASSKDVAILITDLSLTPASAISMTGGNNEWGRRGALLSNTLIFAGEYESYSHPFFGNFQAEFGDYTFPSAGDQDIYIASMNLGATTSIYSQSLNAISIDVYPNPVQDILNIRNISDNKRIINIYDLTGAIQKQLKINGKSALKVNLSHFKSGYYLVKSEHQSFKIFKE